MGCSNVFVLVYPNGYTEETEYGKTFQCPEPLLMNIDTDHQESLLELKNLILRNMGELGKKQISHMAYRLHVTIGPQLTDCRLFWLKSDKDIQLMFDYHNSNGELRCIELCVKVEDVSSSASSKANPQVVPSDNIGRGAKRVQSPVTPRSFAFPNPNRVENVKVVDGKRSNISASPANMASKGVSEKPSAFSIFKPPTSEKPSFVGTGANLGVPPPPKMQKTVSGKGKPVETGVPVPNIKFDLGSSLFQTKGMSHNLEPPITSNSQTVLEDRVKELEICLESKENERAALEELKVTLTSKISDLENKLKEAK